MQINSKQRAEIERILSNWKRYLESLPPASDDLKLHKWARYEYLVGEKR